MKTSPLIIIAFLSVVFLFGCSTKDMKIKKALKESIPTDLTEKYEFKSYHIITTLLKNNVEDSISYYEKKRNSLERNVQAQSSLIGLYETNIADCIREQKQTLSWLRSSYDKLILDYQKMIQEAKTKIQIDSIEMVNYDEKMSLYSEHLTQTSTPIIFYVVQHDYTLGGLNKREIVMLDSNYNLVKK